MPADLLVPPGKAWSPSSCLVSEGRTVNLIANSFTDYSTCTSCACVCVWYRCSVRAAAAADLRRSFPATVRLTHDNNDNNNDNDDVVTFSAVSDRAARRTCSLYHVRPSPTSVLLYIPAVAGRLPRARSTWTSSTHPD